MAAIQSQIVSFTKLLVSSKKDIGNVSEWLSNEMGKNQSLPQLPIELWFQIVSKAAIKTRKDAVILGDYVITVPHCMTFMGVDITPITMFTRKYGQKSIETIQRKTFGSKEEDGRKVIEMFAGSLKIKTVLAMA